MNIVLWFFCFCIAFLVNLYAVLISISNFVRSVKDEKIFDKTGRQPKREKDFWTATVKKTKWIAIVGVLGFLLSLVFGILKGAWSCWLIFLYVLLCFLVVFNLDLCSMTKFLAGVFSERKGKA